MSKRFKNSKSCKAFLQKVEHVTFSCGWSVNIGLKLEAAGRQNDLQNQKNGIRKMRTIRKVRTNIVSGWNGSRKPEAFHWRGLGNCRDSSQNAVDDQSILVRNWKLQDAEAISKIRKTGSAWEKWEQSENWKQPLNIVKLRMYLSLSAQTCFSKLDIVQQRVMMVFY